MNPQERKKLEAKVLSILQTHLSISDVIVVGVSGGPDSVFLLEILNKFYQKSPQEIIIAHLNHQLRKDAKKDQDFCQNLAGKHRNKFIAKTLNIKSLSRKWRLGLEETGRIERYKFFREILKKHRAKFILTAHQAEDNLETIIMNFARGAGPSGLAGMTITESDLFRPLLAISKKQILDYLKTNRLKFHLDKTNANLEFTRNFIRSKIIPPLQKINPNIAKTTAENSQNLRQIQDFMESESRIWIKKNSISKDHTKFPLKKFLALHPALQNQILLELHRELIGNTKNLQKINIAEIRQMLASGRGNKKHQFGHLVVSVKSAIIQLQFS
ncbi:MAG: tRNA lysidine(34) synthetase TilS [Candidatus Gracilibacteria bacterium]